MSRSICQMKAASRRSRSGVLNRRLVRSFDVLLEAATAHTLRTRLCVSISSNFLQPASQHLHRLAKVTAQQNRYQVYASATQQISRPRLGTSEFTQPTAARIHAQHNLLVVITIIANTFQPTSVGYRFVQSLEPAPWIDNAHNQASCSSSTGSG